MLSLENISLTLGDRQLLKQLQVLINPNERIGLTGPNGAGKSTLLKIIAGKMQPDKGDIHLAKAATIGYLPQDGIAPDPNLTLVEEVEQSFEDILALQSKMKRTQEQLANADAEDPDYQKILEAFGELQTRLEQSEAYHLQSDIEKVLTGLGFKTDDFKRKTTEFSGGWLMRIALAKLLLQKPTYLLLDEPTNHLDIESLRWVEQFMESYDGAVIVVSHDRNFLNRITHRTLHLEYGNIEDYSGNFSYYEKQHAERMELKRQAYANQQREIKQIEEFISRFRAKATKARQVQSRIKKLEKMDIIELDERHEEVSFQFPEADRSGAINMELKNIYKRYGDVEVFKKMSYTIDRGDKIAIVGPNGAGKSTLSRMIAGVESFDSGERILGHNVTTGYFAQHQAEELDLQETAFEIMRKSAPLQSETRIRTLLGCFLFHGDDVFKKAKVLSGGEKSRLALARMLLLPANFLIFDEPTNHLDMQSKKILQNALNAYKGTYIIVSHDVDFLDPIVNKVLEVQPGSVRTYLGNVSLYLAKKENRDVPIKKKEIAESAESGRSLSKKEERRMKAQLRQKQSKHLKPLQKELSVVEKKIKQMESHLSTLENEMAQPGFYENGEDVKKKSMEYDWLKQDLSTTFEKWEELAESIEKIENTN